MDESLSNSRLYTANKCRQLYQYKYLHKIKPKSGTLYVDSWERMYRGVLIHAALESIFLGETPETGVQSKIAEDTAREPFSTEQQERLEYMVGNSVAVAIAAADWLPASDWEPYLHNGKPLVEGELRHAMPGWKDFVGYADLVARHKPTGRVLVLDYKTRERFEQDGADQYNRQFAAYQYMLNKMGVPCTGSLLFEMKPEPPKRAPRLVREDCGGVDSVRISADGRFRTIPTYRSATYLAALWADMEKEAAVIAGLTNETVYRNMNSFNCRECSYERLCQAELGGHDVVHVLRTFYTTPTSLQVVMEEDNGSNNQNPGT